EHINESIKATGQPKLALFRIQELPIPIAPLLEQRRIVEKIEVLLAQVNASRQRLAKVPAILKRFRQSVLAGAHSGCLTADWRDGTEASETGADLLRTILTEWQSRTDGLRPLPGENGDLELPESWSWARFEQI